ncbi:MAG: hypothetical protein ACRYF7_21510 [Janthinobacterium lividum]
MNRHDRTVQDVRDLNNIAQDALIEFVSATGTMDKKKPAVGGLKTIFLEENSGDR